MPQEKPTRAGVKGAQGWVRDSAQAFWMRDPELYWLASGFLLPGLDKILSKVKYGSTIYSKDSSICPNSLKISVKTHSISSITSIINGERGREMEEGGREEGGETVRQRQRQTKRQGNRKRERGRRDRGLGWEEKPLPLCWLSCFLPQNSTDGSFLQSCQAVRGQLII